MPKQDTVLESFLWKLVRSWKMRCETNVGWTGQPRRDTNVAVCSFHWPEMSSECKLQVHLCALEQFGMLLIAFALLFSPYLQIEAKPEQRIISHKALTVWNFSPLNPKKFWSPEHGLWSNRTRDQRLGGLDSVCFQSTWSCWAQTVSAKMRKTGGRSHKE